MSLAPYSDTLRILPTVVLLWLAWLVGRTPQHGPSNRLLASFLGVVATGFACEVVRNAMDGNPPLAESLRAAQDMAGLIDPVVLLAFALSYWYPLRRGTSRLPFGTLLACLSLVLLLWALGGARAWVPLAVNIYVNSVYFVSFWMLLDCYASESRPHLQRQLFFVAWGVGFVALTRMVAFLWFGPVSYLEAGGVLVLATAFALATLALVAAVVPHLLLRRPNRPAVRNLAWTLLASVAGFILFLVVFGVPTRGILYLGEGVVAFYFSYRWVFFAAIVGYGILRHQLFDFPAYVQQGLAFAVAGPLAAVGGMVVGAQTASRPWALVTTVALLAALFLAAQTALRWLAQAPARRGEDRGRLARIYEAVMEVALAKDPRGWTPKARHFVDAIAGVCGVAPDAHQAAIEARWPDASKDGK